MTKTSLYLALLLMCSVYTIYLSAQDFSPPLRIKPALSANFGELRNNHFHAGLDYKTQRTVNKPVYAIGDGYVSRISVSPTGYGLALYIAHPSGHTSVYAHLNSFNKEIAQYVKAKQYQLESYKVNLYLLPHELPIKKATQIALSGNTGGSGGPHLHFEIRDTETQDPIDPLLFLGREFQDTLRPQLRSIALYPQTNRGVVNQSTRPSYFDLPLPKNITAWGEIGIGLKAYDKMNNQSNIYAVKDIQLFVDDRLVYHSQMNRFSYSRTRMLNSLIDFEMWRKKRSFYMKSYIEPGNQLQMYQTTNSQQGRILIAQERSYHCRYVLRDAYGNQTSYRFVIKGKKQPIPTQQCPNPMRWNASNVYQEKGFSIQIPLGNLYTDICYRHTQTPSTHYYAPLHRIHTSPVPLHRKATIWLAFDRQDISEIGNFGIVKIDPKGKTRWLGGTYQRGGIEATINELGNQYTIDRDDQKPTITPLKPERWVKNRRIRILLKDDKSGIKSFRATIDGKFALFTHDMKSNVYSYRFDPERWSTSKSHKLVFTATDQAGNTTHYTHTFTY